MNIKLNWVWIENQTNREKKKEMGEESEDFLLFGVFKNRALFNNDLNIFVTIFKEDWLIVCVQALKVIEMVVCVFS